MTMTHLLDRPIWTTLTSRHAALAEGGRLAKRYPADMSAFAATGDETAESITALGALAEPGGTLLLVQKDPVVLPGGFEAVTRATLVQMVADAPVAFADDERIRQVAAEIGHRRLDARPHHRLALMGRLAACLRQRDHTSPLIVGRRLRRDQSHLHQFRHRPRRPRLRDPQRLGNLADAERAEPVERGEQRMECRLHRRAIFVDDLLRIRLQPLADPAKARAEAQIAQRSHHVLDH